MKHFLRKVELVEMGTQHDRNSLDDVIEEFEQQKKDLRLKIN